MKIKMTNNQIYNYTLLLQKYFNEDKKELLPIQVNYAIQKNLEILMSNSKIIENLRNSIGKKYGVFQEEEQAYLIPLEKREEAQNEINKILEMEELLDIKFITLQDLSGLELSNGQMRALLFMIKEE